jgi:hypothetical protein
MRWPAAALAAATFLGLACGGSSVHRSSEPAAAVSTPTTVATTTTTADPGTLPQTHALPTPADPAFALRIGDLWQAIVTADVSLALPAFFPESAYLQTKSGNNNAADWRDRLLSMYQLDIGAAHSLLGSDAPGAEFVGASVPTALAVWVTPGQEENKGPYYRVYGTRLTYWLDGRTRSFGIYSMISWRGEWYVVHLGPSPRPVSRGMVYLPSG